MKCEWCCEAITSDEDTKHWPDDVPSHIPVSDTTDAMTYHKWCWDEVIADEELQLAKFELERQRNIVRIMSNRLGESA
jgi:hypothetical protein